MIGGVIYLAAALAFQVVLWYGSVAIMKLAFWKNSRRMARREAMSQA